MSSRRKYFLKASSSASPLKEKLQFFQTRTFSRVKESVGKNKHPFILREERKTEETANYGGEVEEGRVGNNQKNHWCQNDGRLPGAG